MTTENQIENHIESLPDTKNADLRQLHDRILKTLPGIKLWFDDGKNSENKTVTNPTIGYGFQTIRYADGKTKEYFQTGISANSTGISVYILGIKDKTFLAEKFGKDIGKAKVTGYCIKFKALKDINTDVLEAAIIYGVNASKA